MKEFVLHTQNCINDINLYKDHFGDYLINEVLVESVLKELNNYPIFTRDIFQNSLYDILTDKNIKENTILINACSFDYLVFKDKFLIKNNPHLILDGSLFIAKILGINKIDIVLKNHYLEEKEILLKAIVEIEESKFINENEIISLYYEDAYYDENNIRITPSYLENKKYVFDLETLTQFTYFAHIGEFSFKNYGSSDAKGTYILSLSGDIMYPDLYEFEIGKSFKDIVRSAGNFDKDHNIKCVFTSGFLNPPLDIDTFLKMILDYNFNMLIGNGGICFIREDRCMIRVVLKMVQFAKNISCGKCMPCNYGFDLCEYYINRILLGKSIFTDYASLKDTVSMIKSLASCLYIRNLANCILSTIEMFRDEFIYAIENKITLYSFI